METSLANLNNASATNGVILGVIQLAMGIVAYYVAPALFGSMWFGIANLVVALILYTVFTIDLRKKIGGFWSFREALKGIFLMAFTAGIIVTVINYLFYQFIEPDGFERISGFVEQGSQEMFEKMGMQQDDIDKAVAGQLEGMKAQFDPTPGQLAKNFGIQIIIQFVMSLIFAAIFKKEHPVFAPVTEED